jgi:cyclopropane-fatty-acyl-phospholipid synthase
MRTPPGADRPAEGLIQPGLQGGVLRETIVPQDPTPGLRVVPAGLAGALQRMARRAVFSNLEKLVYGAITLSENGERRRFGKDGPRATVSVNNPKFYTDLAFGGSIGAAEAYMSGFWSAEDLTALVRIIVRNRDVLAGMEGGFAAVTRPVHALLHRLRKNTRAGSRRNIAAHYDLGNDFYRLWLDRGMTYSCNIFDREDATLEDAAHAKYERICRKLALGPGHHVLEIGTGWGGFAIHAAKHYGCRVTTTTISRQQHDYADERIRQEGLGDKIELLSEDYRNLEGRFDALVSIEMIEAVGHHFLDTYFRACSRLLQEGGVMALQAIIIHDQAYEAQLRSPDFIKRYIFPGSFLPSISAITTSVARATDMRLQDLEDITRHYPPTLRAWRERFLENVDAVRALGYPESFIRLWEYYLCYCEGGFLERYIGDVQMIFTKPGWRGQTAGPVRETGEFQISYR